MRGRGDTDQGLHEPLPRVLAPSRNVEVTEQGASGVAPTAYSQPIYQAFWEGREGKARVPFLSKTHRDPGPRPVSPETVWVTPAGHTNECTHVSVLASQHRSAWSIFRNVFLSLSSEAHIHRAGRPQKPLKEGPEPHRERRKEPSTTSAQGNDSHGGAAPNGVERGERGRGPSAPVARSQHPLGFSGMASCYLFFF